MYVQICTKIYIFNHYSNEVMKSCLIAPWSQNEPNVNEMYYISIFVVKH